MREERDFYANALLVSGTTATSRAGLSQGPVGMTAISLRATWEQGLGVPKTLV